MRKGCGVATAVILTAACGSSAAAPVTSLRDMGQAAAARCGPSTARTIAANRQARIYSMGSRVYGCATGRHRTYLLGSSSRSRPGQTRIGLMHLAGVIAAYSAAESGVDTSSASVVVRRLDDGQTLHDVNAVNGPLGPEFFETVQA